MKKLLFIMFLVITLTSCSGLNEEKCLQNVQIAFPNSKIYIPKQGSIYNFIVIRPDSQILKVTTGNIFSASITNVEPLFIVNKK